MSRDDSTNITCQSGGTVKTQTINKECGRYFAHPPGVKQTRKEATPSTSPI